VRFGLELELTVLFVERKPADVHRTVSDGQLKVTVPDARAVGEDLYLVLVATRLLFLSTERVHEENTAAAAAAAAKNNKKKNE